jgi:hypothetical protein
MRFATLPPQTQPPRPRPHFPRGSAHPLPAHTHAQPPRQFTLIHAPGPPHSPPALPSHATWLLLKLGRSYKLDLTPSACSVPKFVAQKPDSVKIRSNSPQIEKVPRIDPIDKFQGAPCRPLARGVSVSVPSSPPLS